jgi:excisionase family DNA binding protein
METKLEKLIDLKEAADVIRIKPDTLYRWVTTHRIPFIRVGSALRFRPSALQEWIRRREFSPKAAGQEQPVSGITLDSCAR